MRRCTIKETWLKLYFQYSKESSGNLLKARKFQSQIKELKIKLILCNISKIILVILSWT
jgi:hypothetical protein